MTSEEIDQLIDLLNRLSQELEKQELIGFELVQFLGGVSIRTKEALAAQNLETVNDLVQAGEDRIRREGGIGNVGIREIRTALEKLNSHLPLWGK